MMRAIEASTEETIRERHFDRGRLTIRRTYSAIADLAGTV